MEHVKYKKYKGEYLMDKLNISKNINIITLESIDPFNFKLQNKTERKKKKGRIY